MNHDMVVQLTVGQLEELIKKSVRSELSSIQSNNDTSDIFFSRKEVLEKTGVSAPVITNRVNSGILAPVKCGREHRYKLSELKIAFPEKF